MGVWIFGRTLLVGIWRRFSDCEEEVWILDENENVMYMCS